MSDRRKSDGRRTGFERRRRREAQRVQETHTVVVEITGSELRIASLRQCPDQDRDPVEGTTVVWNQQSTSLNSEEGVREFTTALRQVAEQHSSQNSSFHFVMGGDLCVTKAVRGSSEHVRNELREIEERSRLYLSLGPGEKVIVVNTQPIDARHDYAVVAVCNRATLNSIYDAATDVGLQVESIEPALVSVCRMVQRLPDAPSEPCLLMQTDDDSVEVGVYHEGRLLLDYRPGGNNGADEVGSVVLTHLSRLKRHTGHQLRCSPPELNTIYLCGREASVQSAMRSFQPYEQFEVRRIDPASVKATWEISKECEDSAMVPALGMLLNSYLPNDTRDAPDFMQHIVASARQPIGPILLKSLIPIAATLFLGLVGFAWNFYEQQGLLAVQEQLDGLRGAELSSRELRLRLTAAEQETKQLKKLINGLHSKPMQQLVAHVGHCMPSDVWLNDLSIQDMDKIVLSGSSILEAGVFDFVEFLGKVPEFNDVALQSTSPGNSPTGPVVDFSIEVNLDVDNDSVKEVAKNE